MAAYHQVVRMKQSWLSNRIRPKYSGVSIKYIFAIIITILTYHTTRDLTYIIMSLLELAGIFFLINILVGIHSKLGNVVGFLLHFLYDAQIIVLNFGGIFTSWVMLSNLASLADLSGKAFEYIGAAVVMLCFLIIPVRKVDIPWGKSVQLWILSLFLEMMLVQNIGMEYTPLGGTIDLYLQYQEQGQMHDMIALLRRSVATDPDDTQEHPFYRNEITDAVKKPEVLPENPNIIMIFTEALSSSIVNDERNIMPWVKAFANESINFTHYYNHTFATYRALVGQFYSGHQLENMDENHLISICDILEDHGYHTTFINVEPLNEDFTEYVARFVEESINMEISQATHYGTVPDQIAYQTLFDTAMEKNQYKEPFFLSMYTIGTHASFDSPDIMFADGSEPMLNKFHYMDESFGSFLDQFKNSPLMDNTILILTADHACFADEDFVNAFPDYQRESADCDEIPFIIYFKDVEPETYDVNGRNSLDAAPTILDLLDISEDNYFLGNSLFLEEDKAEEIEYMFYDPTFKLITQGGNICELEGDKRAYFDDIFAQYCAFKIHYE